MTGEGSYILHVAMNEQAEVCWLHNELILNNLSVARALVLQGARPSLRLP